MTDRAGKTGPASRTRGADQNNHPGHDVIQAVRDFPDTPPLDEAEFKTAIWSLLKSVKDGMTPLVKELTDVVPRVNQLEDDVKLIKAELKLVRAQSVRLEDANRHLVSEIDNLRHHSTKANLIFNLDRDYEHAQEAEGEDCVAKVKQFLHDVMGIDSTNFFIPVAHRIGKKGTHPRPIIATLPIAAQVQRVFRNTSRLSGSRHFVSRQQTAAQREHKRFVLAKFNALKANPANKAQIRGDNLFVKRKLQTQYNHSRTSTYANLMTPSRTDRAYSEGLPPR